MAVGREGTGVAEEVISVRCPLSAKMGETFKNQDSL